MLQYEKECLVAQLYNTLYETAAVSQHSTPSILIKYTVHLQSTMCNILGDNLHNMPRFHGTLREILEADHNSVTFNSNNGW
jgi:hypothetical protein